MLLESLNFHAEDFMEEYHDTFLDLLFTQSEFLFEWEWVFKTVVFLHMVLKSRVKVVKVFKTNSRLDWVYLPHFNKNFFIRDIEANWKMGIFVEAIEEIVIGLEDHIYKVLSKNSLHHWVWIEGVQSLAFLLSPLILSFNLLFFLGAGWTHSWVVHIDFVNWNIMLQIFLYVNN